MNQKKRHHINPLITTNPIIFFPGIPSHFIEGMRLMDIGVREGWPVWSWSDAAPCVWSTAPDAFCASFFEIIAGTSTELRPSDPTWVSGMDEAKTKEYEELKRKIEINKKKIEAEREEVANKQAWDDYYSGNHDNIVGLRGGGRRKGRKSKTKRKGSRRKGSRRGRKSHRTRGR